MLIRAFCVALMLCLACPAHAQTASTGLFVLAALRDLMAAPIEPQRLIFVSSK